MQTASYIVNEQGQKAGVIVGMAEYLKMLEAVEELEAIKAYDSAKAEGGEAIPFDLALAERGPLMAYALTHAQAT